MSPQETASLIERMLVNIEKGTTDLADAPMVIPTSEFLSISRFANEREKLFLNTPQVIGFAGEVAAPGSYFTTTVLDIPVLVTRAEDGVLRAFINACAHRGAQIASDCGHARRLTCPFHGWSYELNGKLAGRRNASAFDGISSDTGLVQLPVSDRSGLVTVGLRQDMPQQAVDTALEGIEPAIAGFNFHECIPVGAHRYEADANWKLVVNLSHEGYHFATAHGKTLAPLMHDNGVVDTFGRHTRWAFALRGITDLSDQPKAQWPDRFPGAMNHTVFPGTVIVVNPDDAELIRVEPGRTPNRSVVYYSGVSRRKDNLDNCREAFEFGGTLFTGEDLPAAEACQRGIAAGLQEIIVGRNEPLVQYWHQLWHRELVIDDGQTCQ